MSKEAFPSRPELPVIIETQLGESKVVIYNLESIVEAAQFQAVCIEQNPGSGPVESMLTFVKSLAREDGQPAIVWSTSIKLSPLLREDAGGKLAATVWGAGDKREGIVSKKTYIEDIGKLTIDGYDFTVDLDRSEDGNIVNVSNHFSRTREQFYLERFEKPIGAELLRFEPGPAAETDHVAVAQAFSKATLFLARYCMGINVSRIDEATGRFGIVPYDLDNPISIMIGPNQEKPQLRVDRKPSISRERAETDSCTPPQEEEMQPEYHSSKYISDAIEQRAPIYSLDDIGGLDHIKQEIKDIALSFKHPEILEKWGAEKPKGMLFYGETGTGKTMLAHALAHETGSTFWVVDSAKLYDMWMGLASKNMKKIFDTIENYEGRLVVFFDEIDSLVGKIDAPGQGGAASERNQAAGIFKTELNKLGSKNPNILIVAATNHLDEIDPALIRSGRFNKKIYVPMPDDDSRGQIASTIIADSIQSSEWGTALFQDNVNVLEIAQATEGMNGADIAEIFGRLALQKALHEARSGKVESISQQDILKTIEGFRQGG
jgi:SpoVK/Ycf46/Vps4 family AAA+-type ATPase